MKKVNIKNFLIFKILKIVNKIICFLIFVFMFQFCTPVEKVETENRDLDKSRGKVYFFTFSKAKFGDPLPQQQRASDAVGMIKNEIEKTIEPLNTVMIQELIMTREEYMQDPENIELLVTRGSIIEEFNHFKNSLSSDDTIIIYSHTHGREKDADLDDPEGGILVDLPVQNIEHRGRLVWSEYANLILDLPAKNVIVLTMSCFSGGLIKYLDSPEVKPLWENRLSEGRNFIAMSSQNESLLSGPVEINGELINPFTYALKQAFSGEADGYVNQISNGKIDLNEFTNFVIDTTKSTQWANNTADPKMTGSFDPNFEF
jgi:hypothetical protein